MSKRILVLMACGSSDEPHECNGICEQSQLYGIESLCKCVRDNHWLSLPYFGGLPLWHLSIHAVAPPWRQQPSLSRRYNGHHSRCPLCLCGSHQCEGA